MEDPSHSARVLSRLRDHGIRIAIDDFGTGYSSFAYLRQLPATELKIDISFVSALSRDERVAKVVRSMIAVAHQLDMLVIAEGVEDADTLERLRSECDLVQGHHLGIPVPAADFIASLGKPAPRKRLCVMRGSPGRAPRDVDDLTASMPPLQNAECHIRRGCWLNVEAYTHRHRAAERVIRMADSDQAPVLQGNCASLRGIEPRAARLLADAQRWPRCASSSSRAPPRPATPVPTARWAAASSCTAWATRPRTRKSEIIHIEGDPDHPVNRGTLCPKGAGLLGLRPQPEPPQVSRSTAPPAPTNGSASPGTRPSIASPG